jgi:hypothetical protein
MAQPERTPESALRKEPIILLFCLIDVALLHPQPKRAKVRYPQAAPGFGNFRPRTLSAALRYQDASSLIVPQMRSVWPSRSSHNPPGCEKCRVRMAFATRGQ